MLERARTHALTHTRWRPRARCLSPSPLPYRTLSQALVHSWIVSVLRSSPAAGVLILCFFLALAIMAARALLERPGLFELCDEALDPGDAGG